MDDALPRADFVAVRDGRIIEVGTGTPLKALIGATTKRIDLGNKSLLPGFVDAHGHVYMVGVQPPSDRRRSGNPRSAQGH